MKVVVAGTGYVGLVTGVCLAHIGHNVTCVDIDSKKIELMNKGISPIYEEDLEDLMKKNKKRLTYTIDYSKAYKNADVIIVGVGTPERNDGSANLDYVEKVIGEITSSIVKDTLIVIKSTVPIGTNNEIEKNINNKLSKKNIHVDVVSNPEFLAQGTAVKNTLYASRIVVGVESEQAKKIMRELYAPLLKEPYNVPLLIMNRKSAEMVKYASNNFLALKISFINEVANLCEKLGANIEEVTSGMSYDSRIGNKFLNPGIGYGGSCFPKDTKALYWLSKEFDEELLTVRSAIEVNKKQKTKLFYKFLDDNNNNIKGKKVAVLGVAFKPRTNDIREAPSIDNIKLLLEYGAVVTVYDPVALCNIKTIFKGNIIYANNLKEALDNKEAAFIMTEWDEIKKLTSNDYNVLMKHAVIYDGRNCYQLKDMKKVKYFSIGRKNE